ncbi:DEKNAAC104426 [Brettanomyces naardenensis]|uniref:DEKNAAC104426 n=1 Tax=Brettanomyces naardenensis TaxID=13370 RepID=A0A448YR00_BRENA|nr:DEKNAAC104426 [Brettanomyces naardenensis]
MSSPTTPPLGDGSFQDNPTIRHEDAASLKPSYKSHLKTPSSYTKSHQHQLITPNTPHTVVGRTSLSPTGSYRRHAGQLQTPLQTPRCSAITGAIGTAGTVGTTGMAAPSRRRLGEAIEFNSADVMGLGPLLFPPAQSTVGSGRKGKYLMSPQEVVNDEDVLDIDIAEEESEAEQEQPKLAVRRQRKSKKYGNDEGEAGEGEGEGFVGLRKVSKRLEFDEETPSTPKGQVMDLEYAYREHIEERNDMEDEENDEGIALTNPFVGSFSEKRSEIPEDYARFETELELVNNRTGKRIIQRLDEEQRAIKPKRLTFEEVEEPEEPQTPTNKVVLDPTATPRRGSDEEDSGEPIRKERIVNPFKGRISKRKRVQPKRYEEIEYINHRGERVNRRMSSEEMEIKPRRLEFK